MNGLGTRLGGHLMLCTCQVGTIVLDTNASSIHIVRS